MQNHRKVKILGGYRLKFWGSCTQRFGGDTVNDDPHDPSRMRIFPAIANNTLRFFFDAERNGTERFSGMPN
jgi:hypothetical protein